MKYKVFYKARQKNAVEHYVKKPNSNTIMWFDSLNDVLIWFTMNIDARYIHYAKSYDGEVIQLND